jgi:hypothetical protein
MDVCDFDPTSAACASLDGAPLRFSGKKASHCWAEQHLIGSNTFRADSTFGDFRELMDEQA